MNKEEKPLQQIIYHVLILVIIKLNSLDKGKILLLLTEFKKGNLEVKCIMLKSS